MGGSGSTKKQEVKETPKNDKPSPKKQENAVIIPPPPPEEPKYGTYTPFTEFPSPNLLAKAQRDYTAANVEHKVDEDGIPLPFPPPTTKEEVFKPEDYRHIDEHARDAPLALGGKSFRELADYLISPAKNDIGKVRAIFVWIANQGLQRLKAYEATHGIPGDGSPLFVITGIIYKRCAGNYPELLARLCREVQIPCKVVKNDMVKAISYTVGDEVINRYNTNCIVYVDRAWRIVDQHWGSQGVLTRTNADWEYIAGKKTSRSDELQVVYHCDDFYFLTDPEVHVYKHWVSNPSHQLLARPVTQTEFLEMAYLTATFHGLGLTSVDPPRCRIVAESGQAVIKIGLTQGKKYAFDYTLYKSKYVTDYNEVDGVPLDRYVLLERKGDCIQVTVNLRKYGKHKLELHGGWENGFQPKTICEYLIDCRRPNTVCTPNPDSEIRVWGLNFAASGHGVVQDENTGGVVTAERGRAVIRFRRITRKTVMFRHKVWNDKVKSEDMNNNIRHYVTDDDVTVLVDLPQFGQYFYKILGNDPATNQPIELGNFIIHSDRGVAEQYPYPRCDGPDQQVGDLSVAGEKFLLPDSHPSPIIVCESTGELVIKMKKVKEAIFTTTLRFSSENQQETDYSDYLHKEQVDANLSFRLKFPKVGLYKLTIEAGGKKIFQYIIKVREVGSRTLPYPRWSFGKLLDGFELLEPISRYLQAGTTVRFKVRLAEAISVIVVGAKVAELRKIEDSDIWEEDVVIDEEERDVNVFIKTGDSSERKLLLTYQVKTEANLKQLLDEQQFLSRKGNALVSTISQKEDKETKEAERRAKELQKRKKKDEEYFERNRDKFDEEEKEFEKREKEAKKEKLEEDKVDQFSPGKFDDSITKEALQQLANDEEKNAQKRIQDWQILYEELRKKMARERLHQAAVARQPDELRAALDECYGYGFDDKETKLAEHLLRYLLAKQELKTACESEDAAEIERAIEKIEDEGLDEVLEIEIKEARRKIRTVRGIRAIKPFDIDRQALSEVKKYNRPSPPLHVVVQATLLLIGVDEHKSSEWKRCQSMMTTVGKNSLLRKIVGVDPKILHPEICARAKLILDAVDKAELKRGAAVATFYAWSMGVIEDAKELNEWSDEDFTIAADVFRQMEIFSQSNSPPIKQIR